MIYRKNVLYCYENLKELRKDNSKNLYLIGRHIGYLEAFLQSESLLELEDNKNGSNILCLLVKSSSWWRRDRIETVEESIIRQIKKYLIKSK